MLAHTTPSALIIRIYCLGREGLLSGRFADKDKDIPGSIFLLATHWLKVRLLELEHKTAWPAGVKIILCRPHLLDHIVLREVEYKRR